MNVHYWKTEHGNFGDDINSWMWKELYPSGWEPDDITFLGVGTLLDSNIPIRRVQVVFTSGTGYAPLPPGLANIPPISSWRIYGVRGKLSARALGITENKGIGDGAYLLPQLIPPTKKTMGTIFIPHVSNAISGAWSIICNLAGIKYVDPRWESRRVVKLISGSKLVLAESMHAAIIADAYRIPWIPVFISPWINGFKWHDWCSILGIDYKPINLLSSSLADWTRINIARLLKNRNFIEEISNSSPQKEYKHFTDNIAHKPVKISSAKNIFDKLIIPAIKRLENHFPLNSFGKEIKNSAVSSLREISKTESYISNDFTLKSITSNLNDTFDKIKFDHQRGF